MDNLNCEIKNIFGTFRTDLTGIRVKKLLKLVRTVQANIPDLIKSEERTIQVYENGHSIFISQQCNDIWEINIDDASIIVDKDHVYDPNGNVTTGPFVAPAVIKQILAA